MAPDRAPGSASGRGLPAGPVARDALGCRSPVPVPGAPLGGRRSALDQEAVNQRGAFILTGQRLAPRSEESE